MMVSTAGCRESNSNISMLDNGLASDRNLVLVVEPTLEALLHQEDTDGNGLITIDDQGPKVCW